MLPNICAFNFWAALNSNPLCFSLPNFSKHKPHLESLLPRREHRLSWSTSVLLATGIWCCSGEKKNARAAMEWWGRVQPFFNSLLHIYSQLPHEYKALRLCHWPKETNREREEKKKSANTIMKWVKFISSLLICCSSRGPLSQVISHFVCAELISKWDTKQWQRD